MDRNFINELVARSDFGYTGVNFDADWNRVVFRSQPYSVRLGLDRFAVNDKRDACPLVVDPCFCGRVSVVGNIEECLLSRKCVWIHPLIIEVRIVFSDINREFAILVEVCVGVVAGLECDLIIE
ncbi:hypothetical protein C464_17502 [Halorubrum coriense DSM 10284]|uniref:Uncharacterized protein n=1 Tax=Halorubrum coriense DSM 10284 TaxID=1227466 RepID=M0E6V0_9EURY|nr:hypothetical protein C464_17502 [Halorubrum coriense DSM 10284]